LNAVFPLYKLFPLCTLSQGGIQDEHKTRYKQDANRAIGRIGLKLGHALAKFAQRERILSEKLRFSCFSQVPAGSDYPFSRPILHKKLYTYYYKFDFTLNEYAKI